MDPVRKGLALISILILTSLILFSFSGYSEEKHSGLLDHFSWRNIGPSNMSGRIADIEAWGRDFSHVLVATASGGVYRSLNAGTTWQSIFDFYGSVSVGDIALFQKDPNIIWIGTGEAAVRNSIAWGDGIYKSIDGGGTFTNMGLKDTGQIARIITHPQDKDTVYVAAQGHLWGYSGERGLFKTDNGGKTWKKLGGGLPDDGKTGCTELIMDPRDPDILYCAFWERIRRPYNFLSGGPNGGIFKTTDKGKTWKKLTNGIPSGDIGRIGLAVSRSNPKILMALVEHGFQPSPSKGGKANPEYKDMKKLGSGIYRSENGGKSWKYMNRYNNRPFYYSQIRINPIDDKIVNILTGGFLISYDGGKTLERQSTNVHGDHHALWCDPRYKDRFYLGTDGGAALTHDHGSSYLFYHNIVAAQFYALAVDMRDPFWVFGGLQDNGTWGGPSRTRDPIGILKDHWLKIGGGDGFHVQIDPFDWRTVYYEIQGGNLNRKDIQTGGNRNIKPNKRNISNYSAYITADILKTQKEKGFRSAFRFNWSSPILLSRHNPHTLYFAGNFLFRSVSRGDSWNIISPDLSRNDPVRTLRESGGMTRDVTGAETYGTIITIAESPLDPRILWVGTDDGNIQVTQDSGRTWKNVRPNVPDVPEWTWVSRVEASRFAAGKAYVTFDGHRNDDFDTWAYKTYDFGETWLDIRGDLPENEPLYVIREDLVNPELLFVGSEFACYVSLDEGTSWSRFMQDMPCVAFHDLVIHPRDGALVAATHGRGIWICDDITPLQQLHRIKPETGNFLGRSKSVIRWTQVQKNDPRMGHLFFSGRNPDNEASLFYYLTEKQQNASLTIADVEGKTVWAQDLSSSSGYNVVKWDLNYAPSERQRNSFLKAMAKAFADVKQQITKKEAKKQLNALKVRLDKAVTDKERVLVSRNLVERFRTYLPRFRVFLRGREAPPGQYMVTLQAGDQSFRTTLEIKPDPLLTGHK